MEDRHRSPDAEAPSAGGTLLPPLLPRFHASPGTRQRLTWATWLIAGSMLAAAIGLAAVASTERFGLLRWAAGLVLSTSIAGLVGVVALWVGGRRRLRQQAALRTAGRLQSLREAGSAMAHQVVRSGVYTVVFAAGTLTAFQAWQALRAEEVRALDAEMADLAGAQRMFSQRIGRLAAATPDIADDDAADRLADTLEAAERGARRLEAALAAEPALTGDGEALRLAIDAWRAHRQRLLDSARRLLQTVDAGAPAAVARQARLVVAQADPALTAAQGLVDALSEIARQRQRRIVRVTLYWDVANLALLMLLALTVAEPTARSVRRQYTRLAQQAMELQRLALVAERTDNAVVLMDGQQRIVWVNHAFTRITGFDEQQAQGQRAARLLDSDRSDPQAMARLQAALRQGHGARAQLLNRRRDGGELWLDVDVQPLRDEGGALAGYVGVAADITQRRQVQADLRIAAIAFDALEAIVVTDAQQIILKVNAAFTRITGYSADEAIGTTTGRLLRSGRQDRPFYDAMWTELQRQRHWQGEVWNRRKSGELYLEWLSITAVADEDGRVVNYVAVFTDITQRKQAEETIHQLAFYDALTELPNRRLLRDRLQQAIAASARRRCSTAVLFLDLDRFKELNDTRGHDFGDRLLVEAARRLVGSVRANDTVARQGGDEFVIVLDELAGDPQQALLQAEHVAEKVRQAIGRPFVLDGGEVLSTASIGVAVSVAGEVSAEELLRRADTAMYEAKRAGRNGVRFFDPAAQQAMEAHLAFEADLKNALPEGQLRLYYQPQVDREGRVFGAEVLLRWLHPVRGSVPPSAFIPVAEDTDLIVDIGRWVLEGACAQLKAWSALPHLAHLQLSVNVSARQFRQPDFVAQVGAALQAHGVAPQRLKLELTESLVLLNVDDAVAKMHAIRALGVGLSMDDFGTGQSSLAYLIQLPLDQLKIDQSFVRQVDATRAGAVLVQTIIGMARSLGLNLVAEGVETPAQRDFLERSGCEHYQGYLFGRPVPLAEFEQALGA
ncbi:MAG: EAL domain-containing protein [Rubrivivax sp.]